MTHVMMVVMYGVPNFGCTLLTPFGSNPSRLIAKKMRGWLSSITSNTDVMPATAPADTKYDAQSCPMIASAYATGALTNFTPSSGATIGTPGSVSATVRY